MKGIQHIEVSNRNAKYSFDLKSHTDKEERNMFDDWTPAEKDYTPGITTEKWIEILSNEEITSTKYLELLAKIFDYGDEFSCSDLAEKYGRNQQYYSKNIWGDYAHKLETFAVNGLFQTEWWPIMFYCRKTKDSEKGSYMFKFRPEFKEALNKFNISKYLKMEKQFTWIPFYKEMAETILKYRNRRTELVEILYSSLDRCGLSSSMYKNNNDEPLTNIDPLTFIGSFNRGNKLKDRIKLANCIAKKLNMQLCLSEDEQLLSIPILNSQRSTLFFRNCPESDYDKLWNLFEAALAFDESTQDAYAKAYDEALTVTGTGQRYATMSCYWINPYNLVSLDENNRDMFNKYGIPLKSKIAGSDYLTILNSLQEKLNGDEVEEKSIPEFSYNAWKMKKQDYWAFGVGEEENIMQPTIPENIVEYTNLLKNKKNVILQGAPGTGKTYTTASLALSICGINDIHYNKREEVNAKYEELRKAGQIGFCTFHQSMDYEDFVEGLRPEPSKSGVVYNPVDGLFKKICLEARKNYEDSTKDSAKGAAEKKELKNYVLIIDEINRGYVSKILGELITLLEADKRLGEEETQLTVELPYSGDTFGVPKNLYIIGTMNSTDRSTGTIDYAVRRRFGFITIEADRNVLIENNCIQDSVDLFDDVKTFIKEKKLEDIDIGDLMVGHSYFMAKDKDVLKQKIKYEVIPLIKEYIKDGILTCLTSEAKAYFDDWLELNVHSEKVSETFKDEEDGNL